MILNYYFIVHCNQKVYTKKKKKYLKEINTSSSNIYNQISNELFSIIRPDILEGLTDDEKKFYGGKNKENTDNYMEDKKNKIKEYGDAFTRFRYASNNLDNIEISIEEFFKIIDTFIFYIKSIHNNNDNLSTNIVVEYAKEQCIKYKDLLNSSNEEIIKVFNSYISNDIDLSQILFSKFTFQEISKMIDLGVSKQDLIYKIENSNLTSGLIKYYKSIGITDYQQMEELYKEYLNNSQYTSQKPKLKTRIK